jgi:hypothetical protein
MRRGFPQGFSTLARGFATKIINKAATFACAIPARRFCPASTPAKGNGPSANKNEATLGAAPFHFPEIKAAGGVGAIRRACARTGEYGEKGEGEEW